MGEDGPVLTRVRYPEACIWPVLAPTCHQIPFPLNHTSVFITISIHLYFFVSLAPHLFVFSLFFFMCFFPGFSLSHCSFPLFFFHSFSQCFPPILTPSHPSQHCPTPSHPYLSMVLCCLFCVFAWRSALAVKLFVAKITKVFVESCGNRVEHYFAGRTTTFCTTVCRNLIQASNFGDSFDQLFLWIFLCNFHPRCPSTCSIPWYNIVKWPKTQIKGVLPLAQKTSIQIYILISTTVNREYFACIIFSYILCVAASVWKYTANWGPVYTKTMWKR